MKSFFSLSSQSFATCFLLTTLLNAQALPLDPSGPPLLPPPEEIYPDGQEGDPEEADGLSDPAPPGQTAYSTFEARYREVSWSFFLDAREAALQTGWGCGMLEDLGDPDLPAPEDRCFIGLTPGLVTCGDNDFKVTELDIANRYVWNTVLPVHVERPSGESYLAFYVQQNNWTGKHSAGSFGCPWKEASGPASWIQNGGDEFVVFSAPATVAGAFGEGLVLEDDVTRPDDFNYYQVKAAVWEPDRGPDGRMALFAKRTDEGPLHGPKIQMDQLVFLRTDDPLDVPANRWEVMFASCLEACEGGECDCTTTDIVGPGYRMTDIHVIDEVTTADWDYIGFLSWDRRASFVQPGDHCPIPLVDDTICEQTAGATAIRIKSRLHVELRDKDGVWIRVPWGGKLSFELERSVRGRIATLHEVTSEAGSRHELWQVRREQRGTRGGVDPCYSGLGNISTYQENVNSYDVPTGRFSAVRIWDPQPDRVAVQSGSQNVILSESARNWHLPGDYSLSHSWNLGRLELEWEGEIRQFLYSANRDALVCQAPMLRNRQDVAWERGTGKSIAISEIVWISGVFSDGFESGTLDAWSAVVSPAM